MRPIRLIAVDLDGTLLTSEKELAIEGGKMLAEAARTGVQVVIATSRIPDQIKYLCEEMNLHAPIICANGAQIWGSPDGPVWLHQLIPQAVALEIAQFGDENDLELMITVGTTNYIRYLPGHGPKLVNVNRVRVDTNVEVVKEDVVRILSFQAEAVAPLEAFCRERFAGVMDVKVFHTADGGFESLGIYPTDCDKGKALEMVLSHIGLQPEEAMAIGDNLVDLPMFAVAGLSVAMENSPAEVRQKANVVAPGNDSEGVAWAVQKYVLEPQHGLL